MKTASKLWKDFARKRLDTAKWVREGGAFLLASAGITILKYILLQFLPYALQTVTACWNSESC